MLIDDQGLPAATLIGSSPHERAAAAGDARPVRVALLRDRAELLDGTVTWLHEQAPDFDVVLTATSWQDLVLSPQFPVDLVVIDIQLGTAVPIEKQVRACRSAGATVLVLADEDATELLRRATDAGAVAVLDRSQDLAAAVEVARRAMGLTGARPARREWRPLPAGAEAVRRPRLSQGEVSALRLYAAGLSTTEVADRLQVGFETVKTYLRRVREKYARVDRPAGRRAELVERAAEDGYLG